jgi:predicted transcriptional regulator
MSLRIVHLASKIEMSDDFHLARLLILLSTASGRTNKPIQGIMKLAKMDFLLRYPNCLARVLENQGKATDAATIPSEQRNTIEAKMVRFRYGLWDARYRRWIAILVSKGLVDTYLQGRTVNVQLTEKGVSIAKSLRERDEFTELSKRGRMVSSTVGSLGATALKDYIYEVIPEIIDMKWGKDINI